MVESPATHWKPSSSRLECQEKRGTPDHAQRPTQQHATHALFERRGTEEAPLPTTEHLRPAAREQASSSSKRAKLQQYTREGGPEEADSHRNTADPALHTLHSALPSQRYRHTIPASWCSSPAPIAASSRPMPPSSPPSSPPPSVRAGHSGGGIGPVEGLNKMLSLKDGADTSSPAPPSSTNSLPSYGQAIGQTVEVSTPPLSSGHGSSKEDGPLVQPTVRRPPRAEQLSTITALQAKPLEHNAAWFVLEREWWQRWAAACRNEASSEAESTLGPIGTSVLLDTANPRALRLGLEEGIQIEVVPSDAWDLLVSWYGCSGPPIERKVIQMPSSETLRLELYPPFLHLYFAAKNAVSLGSEMFSLVQPLLDVKQYVHQLFSLKLLSQTSGTLDPKALRFWRLPPLTEGASTLFTADSLKDSGVELLLSDNDEQTLAELQVDQPVERLAVEARNASGAWVFTDNGTLAEAMKGIFSNDGGDFLAQIQNRDAASAGNFASPITASDAPNTGRVTRSQTAAERGAEKQRGLTGLYNLGNTCFMNSALQCMSNTKELKDYFVSGVYKSEVNADNPLGMGGAMAKVFGELLTKLWGSAGGAYHPREFKTVLSRFSPQFIGYAQQDTQELLAFLLDGLHEDLNRIVKKPYIEAPDWEGGGIREMVAFAHKQWEIYKMRNDSVIVDLFQGQYRSTLVCPDCSKVSVKFDPFMYLTLPIPNRKSIVRRAKFFNADARRPVDIEMRFTAESSIGHLKQKVAGIVGAPNAQHLIVCDYFSKTFYRVYGDFESVADISNNDITHVYELPAPLQPIAPNPPTTVFGRATSLSQLEESNEPPSKGGGVAILPVFSMINSGTREYAYYNRGNGQLFGMPFFVSIAADKVNDAAHVQAAVLSRYGEVIGNKAALQALIDSQHASKPDTPTSGEDWDMMDDSRLIVPDVQERQEAQNTVAEIRDEGNTVQIVPDENANGGRTLPTSSVTVEKDFSLHFFVHRDDQAPITLKPDGYNEHGQELWSRAARLQTGGDNRETDADGDIVHVNGTAGKSTPSNDGQQWPLVYSGGALVCVWSEDAKERLFADEHTWEAPAESFVDPELEAERRPGNKQAKRTLTIDDCLNEFTKEERLGESDPWYCPTCKDFKQASKKFDLWKVPDILVVHLKRFSSGRISRDKIDSVIDFPISGLNLTERVKGAKAVQQLHEEESDDDKLMESIGSLDANDDAVEADAPIYDLYAVDNHYGGLGGGHYTAYAKNPEDDKWYYYDDSSVRPANIEDSKSSAAYLLFYRRRTTRPIGGKSREKVRELAKKNGDGTADSYDKQAGPSGTGGGSGDGTHTTSEADTNGLHHDGTPGTRMSRHARLESEATAGTSLMSSLGWDAEGADQSGYVGRSDTSGYDASRWSSKVYSADLRRHLPRRASSDSMGADSISASIGDLDPERNDDDDDDDDACTSVLGGYNFAESSADLSEPQAVQVPASSVVPSRIFSGGSDAHRAPTSMPSGRTVPTL